MFCLLHVVSNGSPSLEARTSEDSWLSLDKIQRQNHENLVSPTLWLGCSNLQWLPGTGKENLYIAQIALI
ncbi:hypothetical protein COR50_02510 [Chitinophaga caeni]|uniref:Uncharacterized protein n=2 Tax=Chitinophaga caeni TaxID=2029983 RepID=A0A291QQ53_9BACT|nr:hypothetical protein COR50_02510 [Chitinophaga caeni]